MCFPCSPQSAQIYVSLNGTASATPLRLRLWFDTVAELESQAFALCADTPSPRQQLYLGDKRLQDDGRVLALHGVMPGCTIRLVGLHIDSD